MFRLWLQFALRTKRGGVLELLLLNCLPEGMHAHLILGATLELSRC